MTAGERARKSKVDFLEYTANAGKITTPKPETA